jgi:hypothetical protein
MERDLVSFDIIGAITDERHKRTTEHLGQLFITPWAFAVLAKYYNTILTMTNIRDKIKSYRNPELERDIRKEKINLATSEMNDSFGKMLSVGLK